MSTASIVGKKFLKSLISVVFFLKPSDNSHKVNRTSVTSDDMDTKTAYKITVMVWIVASLTQSALAQNASCSVTYLDCGKGWTDLDVHWEVYDAMTGGDPDCVSGSVCVSAVNGSMDECRSVTGYEGHENFNNLLPGVLYTVNMTTMNTDGAESTVTILEQTIPAPPSNVIVTDQEKHALHIAIYKPSPCGNVDFYRAVCQAINPHSPYAGVRHVPGTCDSPDPIHVTLDTLGDGYTEPLQAGTKYYIKVRAFSYGQSNNGFDTFGTTLLGEPLLWNVTSTSIEVFWREPVDNYDKVIFNCTDLDGSSHGYDEALPGDTTAVCTGLMPGSEYSLTLCTHLDEDPVPPACADPGFPNIITPLNVVKHDD